MQTNSASAVTYRVSYDAFGNQKSSTGSTNSPPGFVGAEGYQQDNDYTLMLLGHRYYDSSTGRFLTRDPAKDGSNWYDYVGNNTVGQTDELGEFAALALAPAIAIPGLGEIIIGVAIVGTIVVGGAYLYTRVVSPDTVPKYGPPGGTLIGPKTSREYGPDGKPVVDRGYDNSGGHSGDHSHDWTPGQNSDEYPTRGPGRPPVEGDPPPPTSNPNSPYPNPTSSMAGEITGRGIIYQ